MLHSQAGKEALVKHYHNKKAVEALREHVEEEHEEEEEEHEEEVGEEQEEVEEEEVELEEPQPASKKHSQSHPSYHEMMLGML